MSVENTPEKAFDNSFWSIVREAFTGTKRNLTEGSLAIALVLLAVPMVSEMLMESLFALFDIFFVGKLGAEAIAVVGLTESIIVIVYALAFGIAISATATIARRIGEGDGEGAAQTAVQILYLGLIISIILGIVGIIFAPQILTLMGAEPSVAALGTNYMRVMLGGNFVIVFLFLINAIFRGAGDAAIAMRVLLLANTLNIILAPCFIFGVWFFPELGVTGAAVGTTIGRGCGVLFALFYLLKRENRFKIERRHLAFQPTTVWKLTKISASAAMQMIIGMASWTVLVKIISGFGTDAVAGYQIGIRLIIFALLPSAGMSNAAATLVGQSLGAGKPERAEKAVWSAAFINAVFLTVIGILLAIFAHWIIGFFTTDATVSGYGTDALRTIAFGFLFYAFGMVMQNSFNGAGDTFTPTIINLFVFWLFEIPLAYVLAYHFGFREHGVFLAILIAFSVLAVVSTILFRRGKWKMKIV
ncbi:MAG: MATE family efflux transporter [Acidobacteriota bacterium]|nr:MATE family efflux transporter [Acidobacteriota bacterium]